MKTQIIISALVLSTLVATSQTNEKTTKKMRIKKVENINGVEKITDTVYTVDGPLNLSEIEGLTDKDNQGKKECKQQKIVIITDEVNGDNVTVVNKSDEMDEQMERALKAAGVDGKSLDVDKVMVVNVDTKDNGKNGEKKMTKIVIVKTARICDPTAEDAKMLGKQTGISDNKLAVDKMNFYPNPNSGKFKLAFSLANKGNAEVTILNVEGKTIYNEKLPNFSGNYDKEIDISQNPKGVYFVKVAQGSSSQIKKIVTE